METSSITGKIVIGLPYAGGTVGTLECTVTSLVTDGAAKVSVFACDISRSNLFERRTLRECRVFTDRRCFLRPGGLPESVRFKGRVGTCVFDTSTLLGDNLKKIF